MDVCYVELGGKALEDIELSSDVSIVQPHPSPEAFNPAHVFSFPLEGDKFLCTQVCWVLNRKHVQNIILLLAHCGLQRWLYAFLRTNATRN